jgi:hypothetical protein
MVPLLFTKQRVRTNLLSLSLYIYIDILLGSSYSMFISLDLEYIWSNEVYDHTRTSMVACMSSMQVYVEYMVILILYSMGSANFFT